MVHVKNPDYMNALLWLQPANTYVCGSLSPGTWRLVVFLKAASIYGILDCHLAYRGMRKYRLSLVEELEHEGSFRV